MDRTDEPLRALAFDLGADARDEALDYFAERDQEERLPRNGFPRTARKP